MLTADLPLQPVLQLEATDGVVADAVTGSVAEWADQSASGNTLFATGAEQPQLVDNLTPTGLSAIRFDGQEDRLLRSLENGPLTALPSGNASRSVFLVAQFHDAAAFGGASYGRFGANRAFTVGVAGEGPDEGGLLLSSWGRDNDLVASEQGFDPASGSSGWVLLSAVHQDDGTDPAANDFLYEGGELIASRDGVLNTRTNVVGQLHGASKSRIVLGEEIRELGHIEFDVAAYLIFDQALADSDRAQVEQYLTDRYLESDQQVNEPPVAAGDSAQVELGGSVLIDVLANDADGDGVLDLSTVVITDQPQSGAVSVDPQTGVIAYVSNGANQVGSDSFAYTVADDQGAISNAATVSITINHPSGVAPIAENDFGTIDNGGETIVPLLVNDTGVAIDPSSITIVDAPLHAAAFSIDFTNGVLTYEHDGSGVEDSFTYTVRDADGRISNAATVTIGLTVENARPVALGDQVILASGGTTLIDLLANDLDADNAIDPASVVIVEGPEHAAAFSVEAATGLVSYTHNGSESPDRFTYAVRDELGHYSGLATVTIAMQAEELSLNGFGDETVFAGLNLPLATEFLPDGRALILEKGGVIKIGDPNTGATETYLTLTNIDSGFERGLLDITLAPDFDPDAPGEDHIYLYYTPASPRRARIARFTHEQNDGGLTSTADIDSEFEVWRDTEGYITCCHYGGGLDFGPDGKIWLTTSDKFTAPNPGEGNRTDNLPQDLTSGGGKIIRVNPDGTAPDGSDGTPANPFIDPIDDDPDLPGNQDYLDTIWGWGLRNPFRASWDFESGRLFIGEVGGNVQSESYEDIHVATLDAPAVNFGWPNHEGPDYLAFGTPIEHSQPIFSYAHDGVGASLTGGEVYRGDQFPEEWDGVYFYGDFTRDFIRYLTFDTDGNVSGDFAFRPSDALPGNASQIVDLTVGADGALYYTLIGGNIRRVSFSSANQAPTIDSIVATPTSGDSPLVVDFAVEVSDPDGDPLTYVLQFGDGASVSGQVVDGRIDATHTFTQEGRFDAFLELSDGEADVFSDFLSIQVGAENVAPEVTGFAATPDEGLSPLVVSFTAMASDVDSPTLTYELVFGDGQSTGVLPVPVNGGIDVQHTYQADGQFQARLRVFDGFNTTETNTIPIVAGETQLPPVTGGLVTLLESDIKLSVSQGDTVAAWLDGSGRGNNLDAFGDPQVVFNATPSGLPAIEFDGDGDKLERLASAEFNDIPSGNEDRTVFVVANYTDTQDVFAGVAYGRGASNQAFGLVGNTAGNLAVQGWGGGNDFSSSSPAEGAGWLIHSAVLDNSLLTQYRDGGVIRSDSHTFNTNTIATNSRFVIGQEIAGLGFAELSVAAVLIYDRALDESERSSVEDYLQQKYLVGNLLPVAADDSASVDAGETIVIDVLANDADSDGVLNPATVTIVDQPQQGTVSIDPQTGAVTYTHTGAVAEDSFTYTVDDEVGNTSNVATVSLTVLPQDPGNAELITAGLVSSFDADAGVSTDGAGTVLAWLDSSGNGNDLQTPSGTPELAVNATPSGRDAIRFGPNDSLSREGAIDALNNLPSGSADRTLFFVVDYENSNGLSGFQYGAGGGNQGFGLGAPSQGNLAVLGGNFGSTESSSFNGFEQGWIVQSVVLANNQFSHFVDNQLIDSGTRVYNTQLDRLVFGESLFGTGWLRADVAAGLIYDRALTDTERLQTEAFLRERYLAAAPPNAAPVAAPDSAVVDTGSSVAISVLANDSDADGTLDASTVQVLSQPQNGSVSVDPQTGVVTYTNNGLGVADGFTYSVSDDRGAVSGAAAVNIVINGGNTPPVALNDTATVNSGSSVVIDVLQNDSDPDGTPDPTTVQIIDQPLNGLVSINPLTGAVTYTNGGAGQSDSFTYAVADNAGAISNTATVGIVIEGAGGSPSGDNELVVRWHGDYYQHLWVPGVPGGSPREIRENRWLRGGPQTGAQLSAQGLDLDNDGQFDDSRVWLDFSLDEKLNPPGTPRVPGGIFYHEELPSAVFYGGLSAQFLNYETSRIQQAFIENDGAGGALDDVGYPSPYTGPEFQGLQDFVDSVQAPDGRYRKTHVGPHEDFAINLYRPELPHPIDPADDPTDNLVAFQAAFVWQKEDFLAGGADQTVSLDAGSEFSFESTRWWDSVEEARWIIQDDSGQLYISEFALPGGFDTHGQTNTFSNPLGSRWSAYTPSGSDVSFDASGATWVDPVQQGLFTDIQAFGLYIASGAASGDLTRFSLDEIRFNAVVGDAPLASVAATPPELSPIAVAFAENGTTENPFAAGSDSPFEASLQSAVNSADELLSLALLLNEHAEQVGPDRGVANRPALAVSEGPKDAIDAEHADLVFDLGDDLFSNDWLG